MASAVKLKKGGNARFEIENFTSMDTFTIPAGYKLERVTIKKADTTAGNISIGNYVAAVKEVTSIVVDGAPTAAGNISITLNGAAPVLIPVLGTENIAQTVTKIAAGTYPGWTVVESLGTTVTWTARVAELKAGAFPMVGPVGFSKLGPQEDVAGADPTAGTQVVNANALSQTVGNMSDLTLVKSHFETDSPLYIKVSSAATGTLIAQIQKIF